MGQFMAMFFGNLLGQLRQFRRNSMLLIVPIVVFAFMAIFFSLNKVEAAYIEPLNIGIVVADTGGYNSMLGDSFLSYDAFTSFVSVDVDTKVVIEKGFSEGLYDAMLEIPPGFVDAIMSFSHNPVQAKVAYKDPLKAALIKDFLEGYESYITSAEMGIVTLTDVLRQEGFSREAVRSYNELIAYDLIFTALNRHELFVYEEVVDIPSVGSTTYFFVAMLVMFLMYVAIFSGMTLMKERQEHCLERLRLTKTPLLVYIASKVLALTVFIYLMASIWALLYTLLIQESIAKEMGGFMGLLFVIILFDVALAITIASFFQREESVVLFTSVLIFINALIGGSIIPIHILPTAVGSIGHLSPNYWMIRGFLYTMSGKNMSDATMIMAIIGGLSIILMILSGHQYTRRSRA